MREDRSISDLSAGYTSLMWEGISRPFRQRESLEERQFDYDHKEIMTKWGADLPAVRPETEIITVVPAFREMKSGNLWELMRSASTQSVSSKTFEIIYVVNNPKSGDNDWKLAVEENARTLEMLSALRKAQEVFARTKEIDTACRKELGRISGWQWEIFSSCIKKGIRIHGIDASREGKAPPEKVLKGNTNIRGFARNIGCHIAYDRFRDTKAKNAGIIDFIDGDCYWTPDYISSMLSVAHANADNTVFSKQMRAVPSLSLLGKKPAIERIQSLQEYLSAIDGDRREKYTHKYVKDIGENGPEPFVRAEAVRSIGGYPEYGTNEDFLFQQRLRKGEGDFKPTDVLVYLQDRVRPGTVDGRSVTGMFKREDFLPEPDADKRTADPNSASLHRDEEFSKSPEYRTIRAQKFRMENVRRNAFRAIARYFFEHIAADEVRAMPARYRDFLSRNPWVKDVVSTLSELAERQNFCERFNVDYSEESEQRMWHLAEKLFPSYFAAPPGKEPNYEKIREKRMRVGRRDLAHIPSAVFEYQFLKQNRPKDSA
jgi:hypothetical protein